MFYSWTDFSAQRLSSPGLVSDLISSGLEEVDLSCWSEVSFPELPADIWGSKLSWDFSSLRLFPSSSSFSSLDPLCSRWIFKALLIFSLVLYRCPETLSWPRLSLESDLFFLEGLVSMLSSGLSFLIVLLLNLPIPGQ